MARRTKVVEIQDDNRDKGKRFLLTEVSATDGQDWAIRACIALGSSDIDLPKDLHLAGMAGVLIIGLQKMRSGLNYSLLKPLINDLTACIQVMPDNNNLSIVRKLIPDDIEEIITLTKLQGQVIELHSGFTWDEIKLTSAAQASSDQKAA